MAVDPSNLETVYVGVASIYNSRLWSANQGGVGVYKTTDGGASWTNFSSGLPSRSILALDLDPSLQKLYAGVNPGGVLMISTAGAGGRLLADFDGSGQVNFDDFFLFAEAFGKPATGANATFDLDGNGAINMDDFFAFADRFGKTGR
jgi:hypothetical protein